MSRFVMLSFAFLGWGFYELSGGSDFEPPQRPEPVAAAKTGTSAPEPVRITAASLTAQPVLTRRSQAATPRRPKADPALRQRVAAAQLASASGVLASTQAAFSAGSGGGTLQLASLDGGLAAITATPAAQTAAVSDAAAEPAPEPVIDRRRIRASRVNMRQGPGTSYPVLTRLLAGDEVIVIEDSGTGWLHLRAPKKGIVGWIAASLVSKKRP
ncbi:SH3 domain-containing protein [Leisingera caerulea]|uniref:SH3 domain-containing protein n=1 Tax=Leisingera caerulea TaxID=506591 RepID=UPI0021A7E813|nr:SH3 domain-containing protein [Leisingera caerulea]UWQ83802.1 SH3 domain-containing protein [Leisingera caerulea]